MKNKIYQLLFGFVILVAVFFRFYDLTKVPPSPRVDEVSIGYNAYSILKTGSDEYGNKFPILLRAYDDWRPALYVYLVIPFVALLDLNVLAVRFPSAILSTLSVVTVYFLLKELFKNSKLGLEIGPPAGGLKFDIPIIATLLVAISPWHVYISRLGHEVNASSAFLIFGILFFFRFLNKQKYNLYLSGLFFALSFDSYQSTKIVAPLIVLVLSIFYFKRLLEDKRVFVISAIMGLLIVAPIILTSFDKNALIRFKGTSLLLTSENYFKITSNRLGVDKNYGNILGLIFDNRKMSSLLLISHAYLSHLDPVWLFINEEGEQFKAPTMGLLYLFEFPLIILGLIYFTRVGLSSKNAAFIILWGAIAIIPGAITNGYAHPMRIFSILPIPQVLSAIGFIVFLNYFKKYRKMSLAGSVFIVFIFTLWFFHSYFTLVPRELSKHFQYGILDALTYASKVDNKYSRVIVSNQDKLFESYMFYLYLHKYDPALYQKNGGTISGGYAESHNIGKYTFVDVNGKLYGHTLYVLNPGEIEKFRRISKKIIKRIYYIDGSLAFIIVET